MSQIMKITIYLSIALMLMGIEGCPSDQLASNEVCSGEAPLFKLYVVSDTDAPFDIEIQSLGKAVHKTTKKTTLFNPITGVGPTYVYKTSVNRKGDIINTPFKPTDIHKNKGCIKDYSVSVDVSSSYAVPPGQPMPLDDFLRTQPLSLLKRQSSVELKCQAPSGKQIKTCLFQVTIDEEIGYAYSVPSREGGSSHRKYFHSRAYVATTEGGGTSRVHAFVNE